MPETFDDMLAHFGVPGMKWGSRKTGGGDTTVAKADKKWEKEALSKKTLVKFYNDAAEKTNKEIPSINKKYANKDLVGDAKARRAYDTDVVKAFDKHVQKAASGYGLSPSGAKSLTVTINPLTGDFYAATLDVKHASDDQGIKLIVIRDSKGFITKISFPTESEEGVMHKSESFDDMLAHFGVRGMRWGVRKKSGSDKSSSDKKDGKKDDDSDAPKKPEQKKSEPEATGGKKTTNKKQKADDLSDAQLRDAINRLQMEKQYRDLTAAPPGKMEAGKKFAAEAIRQVAMTQAVKIGNSHAAKLTGGLMAGGGSAKTAEATIAKAKSVVEKSTKTGNKTRSFLPPPASTRVG